MTQVSQVIQVAVDGPVAAGKGTLGRRLSQHFNLSYLDTGALYRTVGAIAIERGLEEAPEAQIAGIAQELAAADTLREDLRLERTGNMASKVAAMPAVRQALTDMQRRFAEQPGEASGGALLDGRDIGTVILPATPCKLFITASPEVRARRRFQELQDRDDYVTYEAVLEDLIARDQRDSSRAVAPLKPADDAKVIDTSALSIEQAFGVAVAYVEHCYPGLASS